MVPVCHGTVCLPVSGTGVQWGIEEGGPRLGPASGLVLRLVLWRSAQGWQPGRTALVLGVAPLCVFGRQGQPCSGVCWLQGTTYLQGTG